NAEEDEKIEKVEEKLTTSFKVALGQGTAPGLSEKHLAPSSKLVRDLRAAKIDSRVEAVHNREGLPQPEGYFTLKDALSDAAQENAGKWAAGPPTAAESAAWQAKQKHVYTVMDLATHIRSVSLASYEAHAELKLAHFSSIVRVATAVRMHKMMGSDFTPE